MRAVVIACALAGCGTQASGPFLVETTDCALVNNFTVDGAATAWTDCRVYWPGAPTNILTVELTIPSTTGSFLSPGGNWIRASVHVPGGDLNGTLIAMPFEPFDVLPEALAADKIALDMTVGRCGNIGAAGAMVDTMADVGGSSASFSIRVAGGCGSSNDPPTSYTGGFIVSAVAPDMPTTTDPAMLVTPDT